MIKPEDIPPKLFVYGSMELMPKYVAHILNQAIEAGVVSSPVYCERAERFGPRIIIVSPDI